MQLEDLKIPCDLAADDNLTASLADWHSEPRYYLAEFRICNVIDADENKRCFDCYLNKDKAIQLRDWLNRAIEHL